MTGKSLQIQRLTKYQGRKWFRWVLVYPLIDERQKSTDLPDTIKLKSDLFSIMRTQVIPSVPDWMPTTFKVMHMRGGRGRGIKVVWEGQVWRDGRVEPDRTKDRLGETPFSLK